MHIDIANLVQTNVIVCALLNLIKHGGAQLVNVDIAKEKALGACVYC